jgi:hypothetical protein
MKSAPEKLLGLAKRHAEISKEISDLKCKRGINLVSCLKTDNEDFELIRDFGDSCLIVAYKSVKEERENSAGYNFGNASFDHALLEHGCINCRNAYEQKKKIGSLKQERGRIHSAITNIGKTLL